MVRQPWLLVEPTDHGTHQAQRTAAAATRGHPTPPGAGVLVPPPPQPGGQAHDDPQRHGQHGQPARPRSHRRDPCRGTAPPPLRITTAGLAAWPGCIRCHGLRCCRGSMGHPRPAAPCALGLALPTPREPPRSGIPRTVAPAAQRATAGRARNAPRVELAPHPSATDLRALCDPTDNSPSPRRQPGEQRDLGNARSAVTRTRRGPTVQSTRVRARRRPASSSRGLRPFHPGTASARQEIGTARRPTRREPTKRCWSPAIVQSMASRTGPCAGSWTRACRSPASAQGRGSRRAWWSTRDRRLAAAS